MADDIYEAQDGQGNVVMSEPRVLPSDTVNARSFDSKLRAEPTNTRARITAARDAKSAATAIKQSSITTVPEARTAIRALCDLVNDMAQRQLDTNQALLLLLRDRNRDFDTAPDA